MSTTTTRDAGRPRGQQRDAIYSRDNHCCLYCGREVHVGASTDDELAATLDHLRTFATGGSWDPANVVTCCSQCNSRRRAMALAAWIRRIAAERTSSKKEWRAEIARIHARIRAAVRRPVN